MKFYVTALIAILLAIQAPLSAQTFNYLSADKATIEANDQSMSDAVAKVNEISLACKAQAERVESAVSDFNQTWEKGDDVSVFTGYLDDEIGKSDSMTVILNEAISNVDAVTVQINFTSPTINNRYRELADSLNAVEVFSEVKYVALKKEFDQLNVEYNALHDMFDQQRIRFNSERKLFNNSVDECNKAILSFNKAINSFHSTISNNGIDVGLDISLHKIDY